MRSNTKLSAFEKIALENMRLNQKDVKIVVNWQTTIAYREFPRTVEFSLSVSSPDEKKFRAKVGEFNARFRLENFESVKMRKVDFYVMMEMVYDTYLG